MKKLATLPKKHLIRACIVCLLCSLSMPVLAQGNTDGGDPPDIPPPIRPAEGLAVVPCSAMVEVVFFEEADDVQVEVSDDQGKLVLTASGAVAANGRMRINAQQWKKGYYVVRVTRKGKPGSVSTVLVR